MLREYSGYDNGGLNGGKDIATTFSFKRTPCLLPSDNDKGNNTHSNLNKHTINIHSY